MKYYFKIKLLYYGNITSKIGQERIIVFDAIPRTSSFFLQPPRLAIF